MYNKLTLAWIITIMGASFSALAQEVISVEQSLLPPIEASSSCDDNTDAIQCLLMQDQPAESHAAIIEDVSAPAPGLRFQGTDLLPVINQVKLARAAALRERMELFYRESGHAFPSPSAHADTPFNYNFDISQKGLDNRYTLDETTAQAQVVVDGYILEGTLTENSRETASGRSRLSQIRVVSPVTIGALDITTGLKSYSLKDTRIGRHTKKIGRSIDINAETPLAQNLHLRVNSKADYVWQGEDRINFTTTSSLNYSFMMGDWQGNLTPALEVSELFYGSFSRDVAMQLYISLLNGHHKIEASQRLYRRQILGVSNSLEKRRTSLAYINQWPSASTTVRASYYSSDSAAERNREWRMEVLFSLRLEALALLLLR